MVLGGGGDVLMKRRELWMGTRVVGALDSGPRGCWPDTPQRGLSPPSPGKK